MHTWEEEQRRISDEKLLEVVDPQAGYNGVVIVHDVPFSICEGEILAILSSNGSGKTTALRIITGTIEPMGGIIRYKGEDVMGMPPFKLVNKEVVVVSERGVLFGGMMVEDNLLMGAYLNQDKEAIQGRLKPVYELPPRVGEGKKQTVSTLFGDEQQMVAIARGLMLNPKLLIPDEPSPGSIHKLVQKIFKFVKEIAAIGITAIMVEQNAVDTLALCDYAFVTQSGESIIEGRGKDLLSNEDVKRAYLDG